MKKRILNILMILLVLSSLYIDNNKVYASNKIVYNVVETDIVKFKKSNGRLIVKTVKEWGNGLSIGSKELNKKNINFKLSSNCKWSFSYVDNMTKYFKSSYVKIKNGIYDARNEFVRAGSYSSPGGVYITVKNNKIIRVNVLYS